jgi:hypothetical protein
MLEARQVACAIEMDSGWFERPHTVLGRGRRAFLRKRSLRGGRAPAATRWTNEEIEEFDARSVQKTWRVMFIATFAFSLLFGPAKMPTAATFHVRSWEIIQMT